MTYATQQNLPMPEQVPPTAGQEPLTAPPLPIPPGAGQEALTAAPETPAVSTLPSDAAGDHEAPTATPGALEALTAVLVPAAPQLPATGADSASTAALGLALVITGALACLRSRKLAG